MMTSCKTAATSAAAISVFLGATTAFADVTAEDVWADWRNYMSDAGYELKSVESRSGDTLTINDLSMSMSIPEEDTTMVMSMSEMSFTDNGDGTVSISIPPDLPIGISVDGPGDDDADIGLNYATRGLAINVSGDPSDLTYTYSAAKVGVTLESLVAGGKAIDMNEFGDVSFEIANIAGATQMSVGNLRKSEQKLTTGAVSYLVDVNDPEGGDGHLMLRGGADGMDLRGAFSLPQDMDAADMARAVRNGFAVDGTFSFENGSSEFNFQENDQTVQGSSSSDGGMLHVALGENGLVYAGDARNVQTNMAGGDLPFPIEIAMQEAGFNIVMPIMASNQLQDFELGLKLGDFTMSDMIWGIFDPAGQLPRDPATVAIDMAGKVKLFFDLVDAEQMAKLDSGEVVPGELDSLEIRNLTLRAAGAELTGKGSFAFDNSDLTTFEGMPAPTGELNLMLVGGNALLDKLVAMGLASQDDANGMRMMMGLFAVPGDGDDTLTSKIEVKGDGQILANGQRIQ